MLIVNADDFGRSREETDVVVSCYQSARITSTTAMVFMSDSERAMTLARTLGIDVGLHLNLSEPFSAPHVSHGLRQSHQRVSRFLNSSKYALLFYNPLLRRDFHVTVDAQLREFVRLFGRPPSHIDGHRHHHLCANVLLDKLIPRACKVRRNFSFWPGEKTVFNRFYRSRVDRFLERHYQVTDFFFSLEQCLVDSRLARVYSLAKRSIVEVMTHPMKPAEYEYLMGDRHLNEMSSLGAGTYEALRR